MTKLFDEIRPLLLSQQERAPAHVLSEGISPYQAVEDEFLEKRSQSASYVSAVETREKSGLVSVRLIKKTGTIRRSPQHFKFLPLFYLLGGVPSPENEKDVIVTACTERLLRFGLFDFVGSLFSDSFWF